MENLLKNPRSNLWTKGLHVIPFHLEYFHEGDKVQNAKQIFGTSKVLLYEKQANCFFLCLPLNVCCIFGSIVRLCSR
jgi:hypothetical protein